MRVSRLVYSQTPFSNIQPLWKSKESKLDLATPTSVIVWSMVWCEKVIRVLPFAPTPRDHLAGWPIQKHHSHPLAFAIATITGLKVRHHSTASQCISPICLSSKAIQLDSE